MKKNKKGKASMADVSILAGATSQSILIKLQTTGGAAQTGLVYNSLGLTCYYSFAGANATATAITLANLVAVNSAWSSGGFKEIDATNMPGCYRFDIPNAALAASKGRQVVIVFNGFLNMSPDFAEIELTGWDNQLTPGAAGGMFIAGTNAATAINGNAASGATPAVAALTLTGGAASTTSGGVASSGLLVTGGSGAGSTNGAIDGATFIGGSTNTVASFASGIKSTGTSNGSGLNCILAGTGASITASTISGTITTTTNLTTNNDKTGYSLTAAYDPAKTATQAGDAMTLTSVYNFAKGTVAMTESYAAVTAAMTPVQALYQLVQQAGEASISGTTETVKKRDQSTTAKTFTINDATNPTAITETT